MSLKLLPYLIHAYVGHSEICRAKIARRDFPIQIDDQDDNDVLSEFCNIFVTVKTSRKLEIELAGAIPLTQEIIDLVEIYNGKASQSEKRLILVLTPAQIDVLMDLANKIRKTAEMGHLICNPNWYKISSRTISSIYRFVRIIKEFSKTKSTPIVVV